MKDGEIEINEEIKQKRRAYKRINRGKSETFPVSYIKRL